MEEKVIKSVKNENYSLLINKIKIDVDHAFIVSRLKNCNINNFIFNEEEKLWYFNGYKSSKRLIDLLYPDKKILTIKFKNNDVDDYTTDNIELIINMKHENIFKEPDGYIILKSGVSQYIKEGACAGEYRNMYWKVKDKDDNTYYMMHIKDDIYTKISKRDINKVLNFNDIRPTWRLFQNGYITCTINNDGKQKIYYLHQLIMDVHNEDNTNYEKTVDHINMNKLDNRQSNLRLVNMSVQNSNRGKVSRRSDACDLPPGIKQSDIPKYVVYRKEILDKDTNKYREYFYICNHPKLEKQWETTKSMEKTIKYKLEQAKLKLKLIDNIITEDDYNKKLGLEKKIDLPVGIRIVNEKNNQHLILDLRKNDSRYHFRMVLKSTNLQEELNKFIDNINKKYNDIKMEKYTIKP